MVMLSLGYFLIGSSVITVITFMSVLIIAEASSIFTLPLTESFGRK